MTDTPHIPIPLTEALPTGEIVAAGVPAADYLTDYPGHFEWVRGYVLRMSPVSLTHDHLTRYLATLFAAYFELNPIGRVLQDPFPMRLPALNTIRQPDLQIVLHNNPAQLTDTALIGPADICVEVVSPGSAAVDYGEKFLEYEAAGVAEYWLLDPLRTTATFYRLTAAGRYTPHPTATDYTTPRLPRLRLPLATLWQPTLPGPKEIVRMVESMWGE